MATYLIIQIYPKEKAYVFDSSYINSKVDEKKKIRICNKFDKKIADYVVENFEQKIQKKIKDKHGAGITSKYFNEACKNMPLLDKFLNKNSKKEDLDKSCSSKFMQ